MYQPNILSSNYAIQYEDQPLSHVGSLEPNFEIANYYILIVLQNKLLM